jgi:hypothetical protein
MRLTFGITLVTLSLLATPSARAELTDAEKASYWLMVDARLQASWATRWIGWGMELPGAWAPDTRAAFAQAFYWTSRCARELDTALIDMAGPTGGDTADSQYMDGTRESAVAFAFYRLDRARWICASPQDHLIAVQKRRAKNPLLVDHLRRARESLNVALDYANPEGRNPIRRDLDYADPHPPSFPNTIGPHGDWQEQLNELGTSMGYAADGIADLSAALGVAPGCKGSINTKAIFETIHRLQLLSDAEARVIGLHLGVYYFAEEREQDEQLSEQVIAACKAANRPTNCDQFTPPFFRLLRQSKMLTEQRDGGVAETFHFANAFLRDAIQSARCNPAAQGALLNAMVRLTDAWRHMDFGVWQAITFPSLF